MNWDIRGDAEDRQFWRKHVFFKSPETLQWVIDKEALSPEDAIIAAIDAKHAGRADGDRGEVEGELPPLPTLDGIDGDLVWMWHCREAGWSWKEIAASSGLKTPAGAWKRFHRLMDAARKNVGHSIGGQ